MKGNPLEKDTLSSIVDYVATSLQLGMLLEVSSYPKPGNVHRTRDFNNLRYEHFLATSSALHSIWREGALRGLQASNSSRKYSIGDLILQSCRKMMRIQTGGNTSLGTIILLVPISIAAGMSFKKEKVIPEILRKNLSVILKSGTPKDTLDIYKAIREVSPEGLGKVSELDVRDPRSLNKILKENITPFDVFRISSSKDSISKEWVTDYAITFRIGYPTFINEYEDSKDVNIAIVHTYLKILSEIPDSFIARKVDSKQAAKISRMAEKIIIEGGLKTLKGKHLTWRLDNYLRKNGNLLNPGTTADLICSSLSVVFLSGFKV